MREILFRGKRLDDEGWEYGGYACTESKRAHIIYNQTHSINLEGHTVSPDTVGQYTGLTDKNGRKIFEGDIIRQKGFLNNYYTSVWYASGRFLVKDYETLLPTELGGISRYKIEVIGNIHDNPELLEVTK